MVDLDLVFFGWLFLASISLGFYPHRLGDMDKGEMELRGAWASSGERIWGPWEQLVFDLGEGKRYPEGWRGSSAETRGNKNTIT